MECDASCDPRSFEKLGGWKEPDEFPSEGSSEKRTILAIEIVIDRRLGTVSMQMSMNVFIGSAHSPVLPGSVVFDMCAYGTIFQCKIRIVGDGVRHMEPRIVFY